MHVVVFAGGSIQDGKAVRRSITKADLVIAADSGAASALQYGCTPAIVVGDLDSIDRSSLEQLKESRCQIIQTPVEKDETDTELAINIAVKKRATKITLLGALGALRFDHTIANILLLCGIPAIPTYIIDGPSVGWLLRGPGTSVITGNKGDLLSLLPLTSNAVGIRTNGLYYPLHGEILYFGRPRGISNMLTQKEARVSLEKGMLFIIHTDMQELHTIAAQK